VTSKGPYAVGAVARAVDVPPRRLEGWVERGIIVPLEPPDGTGSRTRFSREDALRVAIIAEIQQMFGKGFRPGGIAAKLGHDPLVLGHVDTALRLAIRGDSRGAQNSEAHPLRLYVYVAEDGEPKIRATRKPTDEIVITRGVLLVIDPAEVWRKIESRLDS
jgi:MerR-like DNA binding protein